MKIRWDRLGGQLGLAFVLAGFILVFLGWNGAASIDRVQSQFPYLISGGVAGLCLVAVGIGVMLVQTLREERARLQSSVDELREAIERIADGSPNGSTPAEHGGVVAGSASYHRPDCRLLEGRGGMPRTTREAAEERGLSACRVCRPDAAADETVEMSSTRTRRRRPS
jgi:hypothetical protein